MWLEDWNFQLTPAPREREKGGGDWVQSPMAEDLSILLVCWNHHKNFSTMAFREASGLVKAPHAVRAAHTKREGTEAFALRTFPHLAVCIWLFICILLNCISNYSIFLSSVRHSSKLSNGRGENGNPQLCSQVGQKCRYPIPRYLIPVTGVWGGDSPMGLSPYTCGVWCSLVRTELHCRTPRWCQRSWELVLEKTPHICRNVWETPWAGIGWSLDIRTLKIPQVIVICSKNWEPRPVIVCAHLDLAFQSK